MAKTKLTDFCITVSPKSVSSEMKEKTHKPSTHLSQASSALFFMFHLVSSFSLI